MGGSLADQERASNVFAGGFAGNSWAAALSGCYAATRVYAQGYRPFAGGLIGLSGHMSPTNTYQYVQTISECYATGNVEVRGIGTHAYVGGLAGRTIHAAGSIIEHCYALGKASGFGPKYIYSGGLVGILQDGNTTVQYTFARETVSADSSGSSGPVNAGGLVAYISGSSSKVQNSAAIGPSVTVLVSGGSTNARRVLGYSGGTGTGSGNFALTTMFVGTGTWSGNPNVTYNTVGLETTPTALTSRDGAGKTLGDFMNTSTWTGLCFSDSIWNYDGIARGYPTLKNLGGQ